MAVLRLAGCLGLAAAIALPVPTPAAAQEEVGSARGAGTILSGPAGPVPRLSDGKPDLQGNWQPRSDGGFPTNNVEEHPPSFLRTGGKSIISDPPDGRLPYQAWAIAERDRRRLPHNSYFDPEGHCFQSGVPRIMNFAGQILQTPEQILLLFEFVHATRTIHLDGRTHLPANIRLWQGDSLGRWEGDTLVVETTNLNGKTWLDLSGNFTSDAATVVERFTMVDSNAIQWQATITDPKVFTQPWTERTNLLRQSLGEYGLLEEACHEDNQDLVHTRAINQAAQGKK